MHEVLQHEHRSQIQKGSWSAWGETAVWVTDYNSILDVINKGSATKLCHPKSKDVNIIDIIKTCIKVKLTNYNLEYF